VNRMYIVGGGASLRGFDWSRLQGRRVIAVNRAFEMLPGAEAVYFSDLRFWNWNKDALLSHPGRKASCMRKLRHPEIDSYETTGISGLEINPGKIRHGNSSGYAAINVAVHRGAKEIVLLGFDMRFIDGHCHWHDGYPVANVEKTFKKMIGYFDTLINPLKEVGVSVLNANPDSAINAFPKISLEEALS